MCDGWDASGQTAVVLLAASASMASAAAATAYLGISAGVVHASAVPSGCALCMCSPVSSCMQLGLILKILQLSEAEELQNCIVPSISSKRSPPQPTWRPIRMPYSTSQALRATATLTVRTAMSCRLSSLLQTPTARRSLLLASADVFAFLIDASSASNKAMTTSYLTIGEVPYPPLRAELERI